MKCRKFATELYDEWLVDILYILDLVDLSEGSFTNLLTNDEALVDDGSN